LFAKKANGFSPVPSVPVGAVVYGCVPVVGGGNKPPKPPN